MFLFVYVSVGKVAEEGRHNVLGASKWTIIQSMNMTVCVTE